MDQKIWDKWITEMLDLFKSDDGKELLRKELENKSLTSSQKRVIRILLGFKINNIERNEHTCEKCGNTIFALYDCINSVTVRHCFGCNDIRFVDSKPEVDYHEEVSEFTRDYYNNALSRVKTNKVARRVYESVSV